MNQHLTNDPKNIVLDSLKGLCALNPNILLDEENKVIYDAQRDPSHVALICGGGAGHEPAWAGYVGTGMLSAAVCGNVFASPNASQVRRAIDLVHSDRGTIIIVKNYTGDILNFGLAREQFAAQHPEASTKIRFVIVGDDVAVPEEQGGIVGKRGLAGTVLVAKLAGALAARGASLDEVHALALHVAANVSTVGVALGHCHVPGTAPGQSAEANGLEIGLGIHNEPGVERVTPVPPVRALVQRVVRMLIPGVKSGGNGKSGEQCVLLVNNLGGISELELGAVSGEVANAFSIGYHEHEPSVDATRGFEVCRLISGTFMTSLNMPGFSLTFFRLKPTESGPGESSNNIASEFLLDLLDAPAEVPGWRWSSRRVPTGRQARREEPARPGAAPSAGLGTGSKLAAVDPNGFALAVKTVCDALIAAEPELTRFDSVAGDGDCGLTLKAGAEGVLRKIDDGTIVGSDVVGSVVAIAQVAEVAMGGTSGALYSIFFSALAQALADPSVKDRQSVTAQTWGYALSSALDKLYTYTRARPPSRTLIDPLAAFIDAFVPNRAAGSTTPATRSFVEAVRAAADAAENTRNLDATAGRSAYVERERLKNERAPDPGAWGVKVILESLGQASG